MGLLKDVWMSTDVLTDKYLLGNLFLVAIIPESEEGNVPLIAKYWEVFMFEKVAS